MLKGHTILVNCKEKTNITTDEVIRLRADGEPDIMASDDAEKTMILGLEFDKILSDISMHNDPDAEQKFGKSPITRRLGTNGKFTNTDPAVITSRLFGELSKHWSEVESDKSR